MTVSDRTGRPAQDVTVALKKHFNFTSFRPNQEDIVHAVLAGRDVFAALPTGGGKSLCYQLPALMRDGLTVVVSPLIALMKDQVDSARTHGIPADFLNSTLSAEESRDTWRRLGAGQLKLLYVAPERISHAEFRQALGRFGLSFIAVDEAHCISEWGHEFRPDYRTLGLLRTEFPAVPIAAFTATATRQVQRDVTRQLHLAKPFIVRASFDRPEIFYRVKPRVADGDAQIIEFVRRHQGQPGIVYRGTRKSVERTAAHLVRNGVHAVAYHAGLSDDERRTSQEAFLSNKASVVVATIAFGMGIDKANVRWVIHGDLPRSLEGYYQETGRAARDGNPAQTVLFYGKGDVASIRWHIRNMESSVEQQRAEARLQEVLHYAGSSVCRRIQLLAHFDEQYTGNCGNCDICAGEVELSDQTVAAQKILSAAVRTGERFGGHHLVDIVIGNATDRIMERGHHLLPTFGVGSDMDRGFWLSIVDDLAGRGYLVRGEGNAAGFRLTDSGRLLLKAKERYLTGAMQAAASSGGTAAREGKRDVRASRSSRQPGEITRTRDADLQFDRQDQKELFERLKALRTSIAREHEVPPFVVFSDKTLRVMVANRPADSAALLRCHGVGPRKLEAFGPQFLAAIRDYLDGSALSPEA
ncbi:MAG TPA: DNA helicase RecQ [Spirochaetia bacterium]|nr:DNA helicase RecQ [Spirochaetia bacterium]